ncbi:photosystem reaction center subunit H [Haloferax sp. wsp5]|nr:photosystem reaction center subunit H [Haloferax sp. wsp5]
MENLPQEITALVGREVYSKNGVFVGEVEDLRLELDRKDVTGLALHQLNAGLFDDEVNASRGVISPYRRVQASASEIVATEERLRQPEAGDEEEEVPA